MRVSPADELLMLAALPRFIMLLVVILLSLGAAAWTLAEPGRPAPWVALCALLTLTLVGIYDLWQTRHTLWRNYPLIGHMRWLFEWLRPFLRQYIVEGDHEGGPYNRNMRSLIYQRAKRANDAKPFGTDLNFYHEEYQLLTHSIVPRPTPSPDFRVDVGGPACTQPYSASVLNISAMSFGALSARALEALNLGAKTGGFFHDTGEGGISPYHVKHGGDLVWQIGSGYFGCRDEQGRFDVEQFAEQARRDQVKMIEIKLSQGAKPGHGGMLPAAKISAEIAATRSVPMGQDCISPAYHTAFSTPLELLDFVDTLRERSGGKPVGIKLCVGHRWEVLAICKAMLATGQRLDFIVVDGAEGGTGAAPEEFSDHIGLPLREGLLFVRNALVGSGLRGDIRIGASGKVYSAYTIAVNMALGADWCNAARAFMLTIGCVQTKRCHTDECPTGVATQNASRQRGLVVAEKAPRVTNFQHSTRERLAELIAAAGLDHPGEIHPHHILQRREPNELVSLEELYPFLEENSLLEDPDSTPYGHWWRAASPDTFKPREMVGPEHHKAETIPPR